jgi:hypothetical protein
MDGAVSSAATTTTVAKTNGGSATYGTSAAMSVLPQAVDAMLARLANFVSHFDAFLHLSFDAVSDPVNTLQPPSHIESGVTLPVPISRAVTLAQRQITEDAASAGSIAGQLAKNGMLGKPSPVDLAKPSQPLKEEPRATSAPIPSRLLLSNMDALCFNTVAFALSELAESTADLARIARKTRHIELKTLGSG